MLNDEILQLKSYDDKTGREISNVFPITNIEAVKVDNDTNLKEKLTEIGKQIEQTNSTIDKKVDGHIENHPQNNENVTIDDATTSKEKTWSSSKIDDVVLTNVGAIWQEINGGQMVINSTMDGFLREVTIVGNTVQNADNLSDIQHLGIWNEAKQGYEVEICVSNSLSKDDLNYQEFITTISLPYQLMKIGNISDRLYWDRGKGRYVIEKNIECLMLNGCENETYGTGWDPEGSAYPLNSIQLECKSNACICNRLKIDKTWGFVATKGERIVLRWLKDNKYHPVITLNHINTNGASNIAGLKNWLKNNNIDIFYQLFTPQLIDTDIREEIKLPTFINNTYVTVTGGIQGSIKAKAPVDGGKLIKVLQEENTELKTTNHTQDELINTTMSAMDEIVMLLEPLLVNTLNETSMSKMVKMYTTMIQRGIKNEDEIPEKYREQVKTLLGN